MSLLGATTTRRIRPVSKSPHDGAVLLHPWPHRFHISPNLGKVQSRRRACGLRVGVLNGVVGFAIKKSLSEHCCTNGAPRVIVVVGGGGGGANGAFGGGANGACCGDANGTGGGGANGAFGSGVNGAFDGGAKDAPAGDANGAFGGGANDAGGGGANDAGGDGANGAFTGGANGAFGGSANALPRRATRPWRPRGPRVRARSCGCVAHRVGVAAQGSWSQRPS